MRFSIRVLTLLLALAAIGRGPGVHTPDSGSVQVMSSEHTHGNHGSEGHDCHVPSSPDRMPCDSGRPDCPVMASCFTVGLTTLVVPADYRLPDDAIPIPRHQLEHAQFAPVPDNPPPRA